ncbi:MAG: hypothetical protein ACJ8AN_04110 [Archangium sp.]
MRWNADQSPEQARILELARDALRFVSATGQRYRFEDFCKSLGSSAPPRIPGTLEPSQDPLEERLRRTADFFTKARDEEADSAKEKELIQVVLDTLRFIASTGQHRAFGEYLEHLEANAPPYAIASFDTRDAAEAWLGNHPNPPTSANVLIANDYHDVFYDRETNFRRLHRNRDLEYYLGELAHEEPFAATESFASREEAETWLRAQPEPARWTWVSISGEPYLAVYHPNIGHRALYPLSMARAYEPEPEEP